MLIQPANLEFKYQPGLLQTHFEKLREGMVASGDNSKEELLSR